MCNAETAKITEYIKIRPYDDLIHPNRFTSNINTLTGALTGYRSDAWRELELEVIAFEDFRGLEGHDKENQS